MHNHATAIFLLVKSVLNLRKYSKGRDRSHVKYKKNQPAKSIPVLLLLFQVDKGYAAVTTNRELRFKVSGRSPFW
jgi:hypothetical protein